jgi:hypothetical protein
MSQMGNLDPLLAALSDMVAWFGAEDVSGVIIGGVAASILGRPRLTRDVDVLVLLQETRWPQFLASGERKGFVPRRSHALAFARETRVLLLRHQQSGIDVDLVFGSLPFEDQAVARATWIDFEGIMIPLPSPEDLIIMKAVAHRLRDLEDIQALLITHPDLDLKRVRSWVKEFAAALARPDILADLETLLARHGQPRKSP